MSASGNKIPELNSLLASTEADIIIATESWLYPDIHRPDAGGEVFILAANKLTCSTLDNTKVLAALWGLLNPTKKEGDLDSLESGGNIVNSITHTTEGTLILRRNLNLPGIDCETSLLIMPILKHVNQMGLFGHKSLPIVN